MRLKKRWTSKSQNGVYKGKSCVFDGGYMDNYLDSFSFDLDIQKDMLKNQAIM